MELIVIKTNKYEWDFKEFFESDEKFKESIDDLTKQIEVFKTKLETASLYELLQTYYNLSLKCEKLVSYAELNSDLDMSNQEYLSFKNTVYNEKSKLDSIRIIINQKILLIDQPLDIVLQKQPELSEYKMHLYEVLRLKNHNVNDDNIQSLTTMIPKINDLYQTIQNVELEFADIVIDGESVKVNSQNYSKCLLSSNRDDRKMAFDSFFGSLAKVNKSVSGLLSMRLKLCHDIAKAKGYNSVLDQMLTEDDLSRRIIDNLVESVNGNLILLERYFNLKKQYLKLDSLSHYDLKVGNVFDKKTPFEEGLNSVKNSLKIMGSKYNNILDRVLENGSLDVYPRKNKFLGGYNWRNYTKPMVLMNYNDSFKNAYTIAHELGHAVNGVMVKEKQQYQNFHFSVFLSEIASKVNENILDNYFLKNANSMEEQKYIIEQQLNNFADSVFLQTLFLEFELEMYNLVENGTSLSADIINNNFYGLYRKYYSVVKEDEVLKYLWQTRLHLFYGQYRYYNFQYATGLIIALKISNDIIDNKNDMLDKYLEFLTIGGSAPTLESLKTTGIDFEDTTLFDEGMKYFEKLLNDYEKILESGKSLTLK